MSSNLLASSWPVCHCFDPSFDDARPRDPNFATILASNDAPVASQVEELREKLAAGRQKLASLNEELLHLSRKRYDLQRDMESWSSAMHPIRRVPNEIWGEIFRHCAHPNRFHNQTGLDPSLFPWTITRVCSLWRNVAISLPALWSSITIHIPRDMDLESTVATRWASLLGNQLTWTKFEPLLVTIDSESEIPRNHRLIARLLATAHRWKTLALLVPFDTMRHLSDRLKGSLGALEEFEVHFSTTPTSSESVMTFGAIPRLRKLVASPFLKRFVDLPFDQVLHYSGGPTACPTTGALQCLQTLTQVQTCMIHCKTGLGRPIQPGFIILPHLHTLTIKDDPDDKCIPEVLRRLKLPLLQNLALQTSFLDLSCLSDLVERSSCRLQHLTVFSSAINQYNARRLLEIFPSLVSLNLKNPNQDSLDHLLKLLSNQKTLVPKLKNLLIRRPGRGEGGSLLGRPGLHIYRLP
ncbi:hypothetical protein C8J56DRAFT_65754 [Mycena floridula]|nr:hypothetical protein C8J56DRAFT_65754 [Mycena floridula]